MNAEPIRDDRGREIAPPQTAPAPRPSGPWEANGAASTPAAAGLHTVCAWCLVVLKEGDRSRPWSHGICSPCSAEWREGRA